MTALIDMLYTELSNLTILLNDLINDPVQPKIASVVSKTVKQNIYYYKTVNSGQRRKREYLGDSSSKKLLQLARSIYKQKLIELIKHDINVINNTIREYRTLEKASVLTRSSPCLLDVPFDSEFNTIMKRLYDWQHADYEKNPKPFGNKVIRAKDGRRVRSKSECVIYNLLLDAGIPFRYDSVIKLTYVRSDGTVEVFTESPDFLILCPDGSKIIIEHAGMLDSMQYAETLARKLQLYQLNGYFLGSTLFVTSESFGGINSEEIDKIIKTIRTRFPYL